VGALVFSAVFIFTHAHHHCTGNDCPVCAQLHIAAQLLNGLKAVFIALVFFSAILIIRSIAIVSDGRNIICFPTLVGLKVKLSD